MDSSQIYETVGDPQIIPLNINICKIGWQHQLWLNYVYLQFAFIFCILHLHLKYNLRLNMVPVLIMNEMKIAVIWEQIRTYMK